MLTHRERHCHAGRNRAARRRDERVRHFGMNESSPETVRPFGQMPNRLAGRIAQTQLNPLLRYFGFGPQAGTPLAARRAADLAGATGPLGEFIRQSQAFLPGVYGQSQALGNRIAGEGNQAYGQFQNVLQQALGDTGQYAQSGLRANELAGRYAERAASPLADEDLYQVAQRRVLQQLRPGLAARGLEGATGAGAQAESDAIRNLAVDFAGQRRADQYNSVAALEQAGQSGTGIAGARTQLAGGGMEAVGQLAQVLMQQYGIPMQALGGILNLLTAGQQPGLALTQATAPQVGTSSSGWRLV